VKQPNDAQSELWLGELIEAANKLTEAAAFLDGMAERMDDRPFDIRDCAADCRAEARKLRGET